MNETQLTIKLTDKNRRGRGRPRKQQKSSVMRVPEGFRELFTMIIKTCEDMTPGQELQHREVILTNSKTSKIEDAVVFDSGIMRDGICASACDIY